MADPVKAGVDALERIPVPATWQEVVSRLGDGDERSGGPAPRLLEPTGTARPPLSRFALTTAAAAVLVVALVAGALAVRGSNGDTAVDPGPGPTTTSGSTTDPTGPGDPTTVTTQPATGTSWGAAVTTWTGSEYLVWSGQVGGDAQQRADGWRYDPATGQTRDIPVAPIAPRDTAAGVWTGKELVVCCGRKAPGDGEAYRTASAAAFDPATDRWRVLAPPPEEAGGYTFGAAWTGTHLLVLVQLGDPSAASGGSGRPALFAYDLVADRWERRSDPPFGGRSSDAVWTGDRLAIWTTDGRGATYDPAGDWWTPFPPTPVDHPVSYGSLAWVDGQFVVWGIDAADDTRSVGYRLHLDDPSFSLGWQPIADAPIPPIDWFEGTPGSQTVVADDEGGRLIVYPVRGDDDGDPPPLLSYDPGTDRWQDLGIAPISGWAPDLTLGGGVLFRPDRSNPVVSRLGD